MKYKRDDEVIDLETEKVLRVIKVNEDGTYTCIDDDTRKLYYRTENEVDG